MAKYRITSPDGQAYEVTAPDDASEADVLAYAQANFSKAQPADFSGVRASVSSTETPTLAQINADNRRDRADPAFQKHRAEADLAARQAAFRDLPAPVRGLVGAGSSVARMGRGLSQLYSMAADAVAPKPTGLASLISGQDTSRYGQAKAQEAAARETDRFMEGDRSATVGGLLGDYGLALIPATRASALPSLSARLAGGAALGAAYGGATPVSGNESRGLNMAFGAGLGGLGELGGTALGAVGRGLKDIVSPAARRTAAVAAREGIPVTPALLGRLAAFRELPLSGGSAANDAARAAWNRAAARSIGETADVVTPEVYDMAATRQSKVYEKLVSRNQLKVDTQLLGDLTRIANESASIVDETASKQVGRIIDNFLAKAGAGPDGVKISGEAFQALDSALGKSMKQDTAAKPFLADIRASIRRAMDDSISPEDAAAWQTARKEWGNRKTLRNLVANSQGGQLEPSQLLGRVNATNVGKEQMARGRAGQMGALADVGRSIPPIQPTAPANFGWATLPRMALGPVAGGTLGRAANSPSLASLMLSPAPVYAGQGFTSLSQLLTPTALSSTSQLAAMFQDQSPR